METPISPRKSRDVRQNIEPRPEWKALFVVFYASMGAGIASSSMVRHSKSFPVELEPHLELPAWILLGMVLVGALMLSMRGKRSESWAVIAYGALSVAFVKCVATVMWYAWDVLQHHWFITACLIGFALGLVVWGLRASLRNNWGGMGAASLVMWFAWIIVGWELNYATYFYSQRHPLTIKKQASPLPKEAR